MTARSLQQNRERETTALLLTHIHYATFPEKERNKLKGKSISSLFRWWAHLLWALSGPKFRGLLKTKQKTSNYINLRAAQQLARLEPFRFARRALPHTAIQLFLARSRNGRHSTNGRQSLKTLSTLIGQSVLVGLSRRDGFGVPSETRSSCPSARHHR